METFLDDPKDVTRGGRRCRPVTSGRLPDRDGWGSRRLGLRTSKRSRCSVGVVSVVTVSEGTGDLVRVRGGNKSGRRWTGSAQDIQLVVRHIFHLCGFHRSSFSKLFPLSLNVSLVSRICFLQILVGGDPKTEFQRRGVDTKTLVLCRRRGRSFLVITPRSTGLKSFDHCSGTYMVNDV